LPYNALPISAFTSRACFFIAMAKDKITIIIKKLHSAYPAKGAFLKHRTAFQLLVATILSAQSTDITANRLTARLFKTYKTVKALSCARLSELEQIIFQSGFYKSKARYIRAASRKILNDYNGRVPSSMDALLKLPGVGRKTANIVLANAFKKTEGIAVDTHVKRISQRLAFSRSSNPAKIEKDLLAIVPSRYWLDFNRILVNFGRLVCRSRKPLCVKCRIMKLCPWKDKNL
jgi:endonuclease III